MTVKQGRLRVLFDKTSHGTVPLTNLGLFRHGEVLDLPVPVVKDQTVVVPLLPEKHDSILDESIRSGQPISNFQPNFLQIMI